VPYNSQISRSDVAARIPEVISNQMLVNLSASSAALALGTRINMPAATTRFPVLSALPSAYWVSGDTGLKQTSTVAWDKKFIDVEELAVIVPLPENVLDDSSFDVWGSIQPLMEGAIARQLDQAVFLGASKPAAWPDDLVTGATSAGNTVTDGTAQAIDGGLAADVSDLVATLEADGYFPTAGIAKTSLRSELRRLATLPILNRPGVLITPDDWYGTPITYPMRGLWGGAGTAEAIIGDFSNLVVGVRSDFTYKLLTEGVITDGSSPPQIQFNLPQQDMIAMRLTFRVGFQVSNPINYDQPVAASRYPFAVLVSANPSP
jgi:hypothetical protein